MGSWSVDPGQVGTVLTQVAGYIGEEGGGEGLLGHMDAIQEAITGSESAAHSTPVSIALGEFCGHYFGVMGEMVAKTASGIEGASDATNAYVNGDLEMAAEAQSTAGEVPDPTVPSGPVGGPGAGRPV
ncbi:hypothetical protein GCM10007079_46060 [Nocardiopsis terrae]|uniref:Excreted virulence factor EspC, type VII ESX diderm n=1 Tax=Nocardiopsis terrae TaxID=372655 RepID=A0ABR9HKP5_9ACTN|nr:DUF6507 family protein [Nocardiopsis terrae]MBE1459587.1 hypothetical protein [Nocardiopsis terrae]GHC94972.1 hypothetical protein GCM10007079_46060 [Nocardiopsis terrae]